jgi:hypothetical protein
MRLLLLRIFAVVIAALVASIIVALWRTGAVAWAVAAGLVCAVGVVAGVRAVARRM